MRLLVKVEVLPGGFPECQERDTSCMFTRDCANHCSAGDFRTEGGMTPDLRKTDKGWECSKDPLDEGYGAVRADGPPKMDRSRDIVDNLRTLMYGECNVNDQVKLLARLLGEHDAVAPNEQDNRLLRLVKGEGS